MSQFEEIPSPGYGFQGSRVRKSRALAACKTSKHTSYILAKRPATLRSRPRRSRRVGVFDNNVNAAAGLRDDEAPWAVELVRHTRKQNTGQVGGGRRRGAGFDGDI